MDLRSVRSSLYRFIERRSIEHGISSPLILPGLSGKVQNRPLWIVQSTPGGGVVRATKTTSRNSHRFAIFFLSNDFDQCEAMIKYMERSIRNRDYKITGVLVDYDYPQPEFSIETGGGDLSEGNVYIAVTGLGYLDNAETLPSEVIEVPVQAGDAVNIWIPRVPRVFNWFKKYNVYVGISPDDLKKITGSPFDAESITTAPAKVTITSMPESGDAPPRYDITSPSVVKYQYIHVLENALNYSIIPEPGNEANAWSGVINLVLEVQDIVQRNQSRPIEGVHTGTSVAGSDHKDYENNYE